MGATNFGHESIGENVSDAYRKAVEEAQYDYGHRGYTGTIAEKSGYRVVSFSGSQTPARAEKFIRAVNDYLHLRWEANDSDAKPGKKKSARRKAAKLLEKWGNALGRAAVLHEDKWGPAVAVLLDKRARKSAKAPWKGEKWYFFGLAST